MPSNQQSAIFRDLISKILELHPNIKGISSRQKSYDTMLASLVLATAGLIASIITIALGASIGLIIASIIITIIMTVAYAMGRSENFLVGSVLLVCGLIVGGFIACASVTNDNVAIVILVSTIVPALFFSILLLPTIAIIIISIVKLLTIGALPLMGVIGQNTGLLLLVSFVVIDAVAILIAVSEIWAIAELRG